MAACRQRKRVRFTTAAEMVTELIEAQNQAELTRVRNRWTRYDLIVIDELGYVVMPDTAAELLFQVIAGRAERAAVIVTTNTLCGALHNKFNAESMFMRTPRLVEGARRHLVVSLLRILGAAFSISISLSVALKRPVRSFGAITDSRASSFTDGSARV